MRPGRVDSETRWRRAAVLRAYDRGGALTLIGGDGVVRRLDGDSAAMARAVLAHLVVARSRVEIVAHLAALAGVAEGEVPEAVVDDLLAVLRAAGAVVETGAAAAVAAGPATRVPGRIVLCVTGAVAACDAPQLLRALLGRGHEVRVAMSRAGARFVAVDALRAIAHGPVYTSMWQHDAASQVPHVDLAEWADLVLVAPASARTVARLAAGDFGELCAAVALGTRAPVVVAPSMNDAMLAAPAVQRNLARLRDDGARVVLPALGVEVAHAPTARTPLYGPAPPAAALADIADQVLAEHPPPPRAEDWERAWATTAAGAHAWHTDELDEDLAAALARATRGRLIDLGCGDGVAAAHAARLGFQVLAMDVAPSALAAARRRHPDLPITWLEGDATRPRLWGRFDVLVDRGLLHVVPRARRRDYAAAVARLAAPGATLLVKTHAPDEGAAHRTWPPTRDELTALLAGFELTAVAESTFPGPGGAPRAALYTFRRA